MHWKEADASHFVPRACEELRYDERNIHPCCTRCNKWLNGNLHCYVLYMDAKYGHELVAKFQKIYKKKAPFKRTMQELRDIESKAKQWIKEHQKT